MMQSYVRRAVPHPLTPPKKAAILLSVRCLFELFCDWTERLADREILSAILSADAFGANTATTASVLRLCYEDASLSLNRLLLNKLVELVKNICCLIVDMGFSCQLTPVV